jgi:polar amino acid transport system permease protein
VGDIGKEVQFGFVQLFFLYFGLPKVGIRISGEWCAIIGLAFLGGSYMAEALRAGLESVSTVQTESARVLGLTPFQTMMLVVLPQAIKNVLPALGNEVVTMVKESSICSTLGMVELMFAAKTVATSTYISLAPYVLAALMYFCITYPAGKAIEALERRMRRGDKH